MSILTLQIVVTVCLVSLMCALQTQRKYYWTITRHNTKETKQFQRHISTIYPKKKFTSEEVPYNKRENKPLHEYSSTSESPQYEVINDRSTVWLRRVRLLGVTETLSSRQPERVWPKPDLGITYRERKRALTNINRLDLQRQSPNSHSDGNSMSKHLLNLSKANLVQLKNIEQTRKYRSNNAIKMGKLKGKRRSEVRDDPNFKVRHNLHGRRPCSYHNKDDTDAASEATPRTALVSKFSRYIFVKDNKMRKNAYISGLNSLHGYQNNKTKPAHVFMKSNSFLEPSTPSSHSDNIFNKHLQKTSILNQDNLVVEQSILAASVTDKYMAIHRLLSDQLNTSGLNDLMVFLNVHFLKKNFNSLDNLESRVSNIRRPSTKIPDNKLSFQPVESFHDEINMSDETPSINDQIKLSAHTGPYNVQNQQIKAIDQFDIGDLLKRQKNPFQGNHLDGIQFDRVDHLHEEISVGNKVDDTAQSKMQDALKEASASSLYILLTLERVSLKNLTTKLSQNKEWKFYKWTNSQFAKRLFATSSRRQLVGLISNEKTRDLKNANLNRRPINNRTKGNKLRLRTEHFFDQDGHKLFLDPWNVGGANISPSSIFLVSKSAGSKTVKELSVRRSDVKRTASLSYRRKIELKLTTLGRTNRLEKSPEILASRHNTKPDRETRATVTKLSNAFVYVPRLTSLVNRHEKDLRIVGLKHKKNKKLFLPKSNKIQRHSREYIYNTKNTVTWNKDGVFNDINFSSIQLRTTGENKKADNINKNGHPKAFNDHKIVDTRTDLERVNSNERSVDSHMWGRFYQSKPGMVIANVSLNNQRRYELQRLALRSSAQSQYVNATFRKKNIDSSATVKSQLLNKNDLSNKSQLNQLSSFSTVTQNNGMRVFSPDVSGHNKQYNFNIFSLSGIELDKLKNVMSSVGIEHNEKFIFSAANGHKGQYKDIALANTAHVNLNHVITSVGIEHNEHTTVASLANTKPDEQAKVRSILPESFMLDELQESVMCNSMKDQALCLTLSPLSDPLVQSLDYGLVHGYSSYEELFHLKEETVKNGSTTNERPRVANLTKRMKRSESLPTESPWQDVTPTLTTPTGSADTSSTSTTHTSAGNFQHKKVSLFRINQPSLDLTHIMYVPENQSVHSHQLSHFHWKNEAIDQQGKPIIKIGVILVAKSSALFSLNKSRSAIELAGEKIISPTGSLPGYSIQIVFRDSGCSDTHGPLAGIDLYMLKLANVYIGPSCDYALAPLARFTPFWGDGIPILTAGGLVGAFADKNTFKLLTRMQASHTKTSQFVMSIFMAFGWSTFGTVYYNVPLGTRRPQSDCSFIITEIVTNLEPEFKHKPWYYPFDEKNMDNSTLDTVLHEIQRNSRIVVLCASPNTVREIMIKAHELNFDNGEYVFFNIDLFSSKNASETPWYRADDTEERNIKARRAYESLMTVTLRTPTSAEYRHFSNEVKARASEMFPNFTYGEDEVNSFVGAFHDAVLLYALALNETLAENGSISDGHAITKKMWNRTFAGITGDVSIDSNGDRNADYSLLDLNPQTNKFEVVANYFGNKRIYEPVPNKTIHWAGGRLTPPPDTPTCGFDGSKCPPEEPFPEYGIVIIVLGSILLIVLITVFFIYRHIKLEAELAEMNWRVRWEDILFGAPEKNKKLERQGSRLSLRKGSLPSDCSGDTIAVHLNDAGNRQLFTRTGYYKGAIIAIKPIPRSNITINKPMLLEIKRMKDLQNDHIVRFIGACIDFPNSCILTEYCPKGSLQDVLENEQIKLDWMFRYSIMQDIVRGMAYLQGTEVRSHGYLKSTNCVVDSRFVVKITDFGLHHLRGAIRNNEEDEHSYSYFHNKLWTAPELLRMAYRPPEGTIKADVYSFAIICQEIVYRNGVFYMQNLDLSPQEIYQKVKLGAKPYFRPTLEEYDCPCDELAGVIRRCWAEDPADRPDFQALKSIIRKLNRDGDKGNILDNLLSRMEQYANNLEALVEERTADYLQQKKKAEDLLYNMLPKKVASQLIRGESVTAEWYDSVSIYFSDICGFTAMSAESTPMEVVDLLNDLYTTFDSIIENFDVYKVETIGDAYMVVSGLPDRNGILHAREIARMSLSLLKATLTFRIRHRPKDRLKIRIGIHTGSVCAGVVGLKMPRYCLFGDTVNTASRMESNGLPLKIHVSPQCKDVLDTFGTFELELRGNVEMKGKGSVKTYWLHGEKTSSDSPGVSLNIL